MRALKENESLQKSEFVYFSVGAGCFIHNYLCAVCFKESAVLDVKPHDPSVLLPCWLCQGKGWQLKRKNKWFREVLDWMLGV